LFNFWDAARRRDTVRRVTMDSSRETSRIAGGGAARLTQGLAIA